MDTKLIDRMLTEARRQQERCGKVLRYLTPALDKVERLRDEARVAEQRYQAAYAELAASVQYQQWMALEAQIKTLERLLMQPDEGAGQRWGAPLMGLDVPGTTADRIVGIISPNPEFPDDTIDLPLQWQATSVQPMPIADDDEPVQE